MEYKLLSKFYYMGNDTFAEEYKRRIESISCLKFNFVLNDSNIFMMATPGIINLIWSICQKNTELTAKLNHLPGVAVHSTTHIMPQYMNFHQ